MGKIEEIEKIDREQKRLSDIGIATTVCLGPANDEMVAWVEARQRCAVSERTQHLRLTQSELMEYRSASGLDEVMELDRLFFERHGTTGSFERPICTGEVPLGALPSMLPGRCGDVYVFYLGANSRARLMVPGEIES